MRLVVVKDGKYMKMIDVCLLKTTDITWYASKYSLYFLFTLQCMRMYKIAHGGFAQNLTESVAACFSARKVSCLQSPYFHKCQSKNSYGNADANISRCYSKSTAEKR